MPDDGAATAKRALLRVYPELSDARMELTRSYTNDLVRKARVKFNV